ncbi:SPOR domain-containing protein [Nesterenkonia aerolata]|uniref:SPOR domain-containing protein n=1 Tax=Nesterenkonia aerolata TaxID=3074079 RepID=A0ABU2DUQ4_9MICC|nr:SPOR domain-containing protein [Nesterenkonia sp. LY-0111]MDR8020223.1 SPOR domain-containing protein [Nesterenkonia sp. LY-0111]
MAEYWYNLQTGEVEEGQQSSWSKLLGPYSTREEASRAMQRVDANNEAWDEADEDA